MEKGIQKLSPLLDILPKGHQKKFFYNYGVKFLFYFIFILFFFLHKQEWLECLSKIRCNKNEKIFMGAFLNVSRPFQAN
jgi:hypothetical protein